MLVLPLSFLLFLELRTTRQKAVRERTFRALGRDRIGEVEWLMLAWRLFGGQRRFVRRLPLPPKYIHQSRVLRFVCGAEFHPNQVQCIACPWSGILTGFSPHDAGTAGRVGQTNGMRAIGMWKHILAFSLLQEFQNCLLLSGIRQCKLGHFEVLDISKSHFLSWWRLRVLWASKDVFGYMKYA